MTNLMTRDFENYTINLNAIFSLSRLEIISEIIYIHDFIKLNKKSNFMSLELKRYLDYFSMRFKTRFPLHRIDSYR